ncbi:MAG: DUF2062 domain-containing protein [Gammaproteobacteria bacterium]|nr:DUF2062 domain-containing protein [Gammaproteobacteria bacterium]
MFRFRLPRRDEVLKTWPLNYVAAYLTAPGLWAFRRHSVSLGAAWGMFCCYLPIPFQMIVATIGCLMWHINLPVAMVCVWITNPITIPFMLYFAYIVGDILIPSEASLAFADIENAGGVNDLVHAVSDLFGDLLPQLLIGCFVLGSVLALIGYVSVQAAWIFWMRHRWSNIIRIRKLKNFMHLNNNNEQNNSHRDVPTAAENKSVNHDSPEAKNDKKDQKDHRDAP